MVDILALLNGVRRSGKGWTARCPSHDDKNNSLSVHHRDGKWLLHCHAGCTVPSHHRRRSGIRSPPKTFFQPGKGRGAHPPPEYPATAQPLGLTLAQYAAAKAASQWSSCGNLGLSDVSYQSRPALRIPYLGADGAEAAVRFRIALEGDRFRWKSGGKPVSTG